jgi:hypothetical protein
LFGKIYDQFQCYQLALWMAAGISTVSSGLIMTMRRIDPPFTSEKGGHSLRLERSLELY